ncbi:MAG: PAP/fibrillin family protein [Pseudanabaenaceae cyanobacterium SKYGB_i_bin29]|nr:PAP/fibrillin family protein [Pseudanabaenaceae cyanobacterium SKYG29]MDW8422342.1 PAP/fibrillin family protein [Pseudanabaenaceae cyanobacterium SKYGB_i_bin29]
MSKKTELLNLLVPLDRGLKVSTNALEQVLSIVSALEKENPNPTPTSDPQLLQGNWRMLFTTSRSLLVFGRLPLSSLGGVYQYIDTDRQQVYNVAEIRSLPLFDSIVSVVADFTILSEKRIGVQFTRSIVGLQTLLGYQNVDRFIEQLQSGTRLVALDTPITRRGNSWVDVTYIDDDLRITRGNEGNIFILQRV